MSRKKGTTAREKKSQKRFEIEKREGKGKGRTISFDKKPRALQRKSGEMFREGAKKKKGKCSPAKVRGGGGEISPGPLSGKKRDKYKKVKKKKSPKIPGSLAKKGKKKEGGAWPPLKKKTKKTMEKKSGTTKKNHPPPLQEEKKRERCFTPWKKNYLPG